MNLARILGAVFPMASLVAAIWFAVWAETVRRSRRKRESLLAYLAEHPDVSTAHLARRLRIPYSSTVVELDNLEAVGRVARHHPYSGPFTWHLTDLDDTTEPEPDPAPGPELVRVPLVHDYRPDRLTWGRNYIVHRQEITNDGETMHVSGWGHVVYAGDVILLEHDGRQGRYEVTAIEYHTDPADMWAADLIRSTEPATP